MSFAYQINNGIPILTWTDNFEDDEVGSFEVCHSSCITWRN